MKFGLTEEQYELIERVLRSFPNIQEVLVFGSRAMGNYKPTSDIDLALKGKNLDIAKIMGVLNDEIPLAFEFDVVDYNDVSVPELKEHIDANGKKFLT